MKGVDIESINAGKLVTLGLTALNLHDTQQRPYFTRSRTAAMVDGGERDLEAHVIRLPFNITAVSRP